MNQTDLQMHVKEQETRIERMEALSRLYENKDFQNLILNHYFIEEASRLVLLRQDDNVLNDEKLVEKIDMKLIGIGELQKFFNAVVALGANAKTQLEDNKEEIEEDING